MKKGATQSLNRNTASAHRTVTRLLAFQHLMDLSWAEKGRLTLSTSSRKQEGRKGQVNTHTHIQTQTQTISHRFSTRNQSMNTKESSKTGQNTAHTHTAREIT